MNFLTRRATNGSGTRASSGSSYSLAALPPRGIVRNDSRPQDFEPCPRTWNNTVCRWPSGPPGGREACLPDRRPEEPVAAGIGRVAPPKPRRVAGGQCSGSGVGGWLRIDAGPSGSFDADARTDRGHCCQPGGGGGLPDPLGEVMESSVRPNGLEVSKVRVPLGVVFFIYESRPNVTADAAGICLKSGNAVILRGGRKPPTPAASGRPADRSRSSKRLAAGRGPAGRRRGSRGGGCSANWTS